MANIPPEDALRAELEHVRAQLTNLVERRLASGLTPEEDGEYRRLTNLERDLLRSLEEATTDAPSEPPA